MLAVVFFLSACSPENEGTNARAGGDGGMADSGGASPVTAGEPIAIDSRPECDPLDPSYCAFPYPSSLYLEADPSTPTGQRLKIPAAALPKNTQGKSIHSSEYDTLDGYSPQPQILFYFADLDPEGAADWGNPARSLEPGSPTVVLELGSGRRIAHVLEISQQTTKTDPRRAVYIRLLERLREGGRYGVALRGMRTAGGAEIQPSPAFLALRDKRPSNHEALEKRRPRFEALFTALEKAGVARAGLQLAWDFDVMSQTAIAGRLLRMRDDALGRLPASGPEYAITRVEDFTAEQEPHLARRLTGTFRVPLYLDSVKPGGRLVLDAQENPVFQGWANAPFQAVIPRKAVREGGTLALLHYGHGLLLSGQIMLSEKEGIFLRQQADEYNYLVAASDWWGMCREDLGHIAGNVVPDLSRFPEVPDRLHQGILNQVLLAAMMKGPFAGDPRVTLDGKVRVEAGEVLYYGNSLGGIMGTPYMALSPWVKRGVLGVPGQAFSFMLTRSVDFSAFMLVLTSSYPGNFDRLFALSQVQDLWVRAEALGYGARMLTDRLPDTPDKQVLMHIAREDSEVANKASEMLARAAGVPYMTPGPSSPWGLKEQPYPHSGSGYVEWDFKAAPAPQGDLAPDANNGTHLMIRALPAAKKQIDRFLRAGVIEQTCNGVCDPE
ncbi:MAG: hypothetical protein GMKNLPBB_01709 [Myxococcota bacterium]|nr:hypothetical protein [Myxococcota bacterium]